MKMDAMEDHPMADAEKSDANAENSDATNDESEADCKLKRKEYERELARLHVEFVKLQQWVVHKGLKVCILFEGRDGAGKGGTIKAMTERLSPRIFRVVALPAPTEREKSQMYAQRYIPHLPAAGEVMIFDRSWYNRAGVEASFGVLHRGASQALSADDPRGRESHRRRGDYFVEILAGGES
jgi:polyphosphate kinase 2 (PPK2 family)